MDVQYEVSALAFIVGKDLPESCVWFEPPFADGADIHPHTDMFTVGVRAASNTVGSVMFFYVESAEGHLGAGVAVEADDTLKQ